MGVHPENIGQVIERYLGMAAWQLGSHCYASLDGATDKDVSVAKEAGLPSDVKTICTTVGPEPFETELLLGLNSWKLAHMADDKIHARLIGPYLVMQQPLESPPGVSGSGMEVWASAYGAATPGKKSDL